MSYTELLKSRYNDFITVETHIYTTCHVMFIAMTIIMMHFFIYAHIATVAHVELAANSIQIFQATWAMRAEITNYCLDYTLKNI